MVLTNTRLAFTGVRPDPSVFKNTKKPEKVANVLDTENLKKPTIDNLKAYFLPTFTAEKTDSDLILKRIFKTLVSGEADNFNAKVNISGNDITVKLTFETGKENYEINYSMKNNPEKEEDPIYSDGTVVIKNKESGSKEEHNLTAAQIKKIADKIIVK
ncbi:MAG: hypothetical protein AB1782_03845 [Cyanobacteriota bacterium]